MNWGAPLSPHCTGAFKGGEITGAAEGQLIRRNKELEIRWEERAEAVQILLGAFAGANTRISMSRKFYVVVELSPRDGGSRGCNRVTPEPNRVTPEPSHRDGTDVG